jgi:uncharacterized protein (TIGR02246 family)
VVANRLSADDRLDILDLVARYAHSLDTGDLDGYVDNFAPDAVLFDRCHGREEIRAYVAQLMQEGRAGPLPNGDVAYRHFAQAVTIDAEASDRARVHSYLLWVNMGPEPPVSAAAEYLDTVVKLDGRWYFQSHHLNPLAGRIPGPQPVIPHQAQRAEA